MKELKKLIIIDIGSHKLEELAILLHPRYRHYFAYAKWAIISLLRAIKRFDFQNVFRLNHHVKNLKYYFFSKRLYNLHIVSIEPNIDVVHAYIKKLSKKYPVHYIPVAVLGHDAKKNAELKKLFFYDKTISSSIYKKDSPMDSEKANLCVGLKFEVIWDGLVEQGLVYPDDQFILRMNCEGAELGIIEDCHVKGLKPLSIIGSLGDIEKIHGKRSWDKAKKILKEMKTQYHYFKGDNPSTWYDMIDIWENYTSGYRKY